MLGRYPIISDQITKLELRHILQCLEGTLAAQVPGDVVEMGCFVGTASLFLQRTLVAQAPAKQLHVYDSFQGLPPKTEPDSSPAGEQFAAGELRASKQTLIKQFKHASLPLPVIHKAWFGELTDQDMPASVAFAFLDGDFYESIQDSLHVVWPRLAPGAVVVVDDYQSEALPGVKRAVDQWLQTHAAGVRIVASLAVLRV